MTRDAALPLHFCNSVLQVVLFIIFHVHRRHKPGCVGKEIVHLLKRTFRGFWLDCPEEEGVGEIADDLHNYVSEYHVSDLSQTYEEDVVFPADVVDGNRGDLANHGVESEAHHDGDTDTLGSSTSVEDFGRHDPWITISTATSTHRSDTLLTRQWSVSGRKAEVVYPGYHDETPFSTLHVSAMRNGGGVRVPTRLDEEPGGNFASSAVAMMKVTQLPRLPPIMAQRRPV